MEKLILFDIDRTLLKNAAGHRNAFLLGVKQIYGIDTTLEVINYSGLTDQQILFKLLGKNGLDEFCIQSQRKECLEAIITNYETIFKATDPLILLDGAAVLLEELNRRGFLIGLATGNLEPIAWGKMERMGLKHYFKLGGFGSDDPDRAVLVKLAIQRAEKDFNFIVDNNVFLFGDTVYDISAGNAAGIITIGVATGSCSKEELLKAGATYALDNLKDTKSIIDLITKR